MIHQAHSGVCLSKTKILRYLLEGTAGANVESVDEEKDAIETFNNGVSAGGRVSMISLPTPHVLKLSLSSFSSHYTLWHFIMEECFSVPVQ